MFDFIVEILLFRRMMIQIALKLSSRFHLKTLKDCTIYHFFSSGSAAALRGIVSATLTIQFEMLWPRSSAEAAAAIRPGYLLPQLAEHCMTDR